jgi:hypothetical protein
MIKRLIGPRITLPLGARRVAVPVVFLALAICCCGPLSLAVVDSGIRQAGLLPTYTPRPSATERPIDTPRPSQTERPMNTPAPTAQPTIAPTSASTRPPATAAPAAAGTATPSAADLAYINAVVPILNNSSDGLNWLGEQFTAAGKTPTLLTDDGWRTKVAGALLTISWSDIQLRKLTPTARFADVHAELLQAADHYDAAVALTTAGLDKLDGAKLSQAAERLNAGTAAIQRAKQKLAGAPVQSVAQSPTANTAANLRAGPGQNYAITGGVTAGQQLNIVAKNPAGDWYQLASGAWIFGNLVDNAPDIPVASSIPAPPVSAPAAAVPTVRELPAAAASSCDCDHGDTLNCDDFDNWDAQACYLRCKNITGRDVHGLDRDNDGSACDWEQ